MTEDEACRVNKKFLDYLSSKGLNSELRRICDNQLEVKSEPYMMSFLVLSERKNFTVKPSNIRFHLYNAVRGAILVDASWQIPENLISFFVAVIGAIDLIAGTMVEEISETEASIAAFLYRNKGEKGIEEETFLREYKKWSMKYFGSSLDEKTVQNYLTKLINLHVIEIVDGKVYLKETVLLNR